MTILNIFFIYFSRILDRWGGIIFSSTPSPFCVCETGPEEHKSAKHVNIMTGWGLGEVIVGQPWKSAKHILQKIRETLKSVRAIFDVSSRYRSIAGEYMINLQIINTIAGEHIPGSIKFNNVYARYRLDSGQTSPAIFRLLKCVNKNLLKAR